MKCNCFSKDSANSWMEFDLFSVYELSAEGVLLAFLWQWHLQSWSSSNSLEPLRWPEDEPLVEAWSRVVWREESLACKTRGLGEYQMSKQSTQDRFSLLQSGLQTMVPNEGPFPDSSVFPFTCTRFTPQSCFPEAAADIFFFIITIFEYLSFSIQISISNAKCAGSSWCPLTPQGTEILQNLKNPCLSSEDGF